MTTTQIHDSNTCTLNSDKPCSMCAAAIAYETQRVIDQVHELMAEDCDCEKHRDQIASHAFEDDWELAPLSMTRTTERECAEYWYEMGARTERCKLLTVQNADMREMLRVGNERIQR